MKKIKLTQGKYALVDDEDYEWLNKYKWYAAKMRNSWYANRGQYKLGKTKIITMSRVILNLTNSKIFVDHKDHNGLNNQRYNIRECTPSENAKNKRPYGTSKYLGVAWLQTKTNGGWLSSIRVKSIQKHLGYFKTELEAAIIYNIAARKYHGEFANPNKFLK